MRYLVQSVLMKHSVVSETNYHTPVLLDRCVNELVIDPSGVYIDVTYGGGGHSKAVLNRLTAKGRLFGIDQDADAMTNAVEDDRFVFVRSNFEYIEHFMRYYEVDQVDGILADLGVSSYHFDEAERGFSYRFDADLDMRMNNSAGFSAKDVLASYSAGELQDIFSKYGEIRNSKTLAKVIVVERQKKAILTTGDLEMVLASCCKGDRQKYLSQVYQSLRIEVNNEFGVLKTMLEQGRRLLAPGGRFVVLTYHSLEDKIVKQFFRDNNFSGKRLEDDFGRAIVDLKVVNSRPIVAEEAEVKLNRRAASAKLRIAEKVK